jgi:hypothetical protein
MIYKRLLSLFLAMILSVSMVHSFSLSMLSLSSTTTTTHLPRVIQGGMGIRISSWQLAREVSRKGELGVVSGTVIDTILVRELQTGTYRNVLQRMWFVLFDSFSL